ncbi:MAG: leucine-rich repeat domain-containing protein, partial [Bacteroidales bacterium]|nr:leucine-rich repeat domain-containing protein [Bacteroidales bacterium]
MKKIVVLLTIALCICATNKAMGYDFLSVNSNGDTIYYKIKSSTPPLTAEVTYKALNESSYKGNIVIPDTVTPDSNSYIVISIGDSAFRNCSALISITIPNTVTTIGKNTFEKCIGLTSVIIGNSVKTIWDKAFSECIGLTSIIIPASVTSIHNNAFSKDSNLVTVKFDARNCTYMGDKGRAYRVFLDCPLLSKLIIGDDVQIIPELAFAECNALDTVTIGKSVTAIRHAAFLNDTNLIT